MRKSTQDRPTQAGNRIVLAGTVLLLLAYMLWTIVRAYLAGGPDAPTVKILLLGIAVLGGGILFSASYLIFLLKQYAQAGRSPRSAGKRSGIRQKKQCHCGPTVDIAGPQ